MPILGVAVPYVPHTRVTFGGANQQIPGEIWSCNVNVQRPAPDFGPLLDHEAYLNAIQAALTAWFVSSTNKISNVATLAYVKANAIGTDGKYSDPTVTHQHNYTSTIVGGSAPSAMWGLLSFATSWTTARMRGVGSHGRVYLPNYTLPPAANGGVTIDVTAQSLLLTAGKGLLTVLASSGATLCEPIVASKGGKSGGGINSKITGVRIGNVVDVQRRRKNALLETYVAGAWP